MDRTQLIAAGFQAENGPDGERLFKCQPVVDMPYVNENIVDGDYVAEGMVGVTEVLPDGRVQMSIDDADYREGPHAAGSPEALALLKDATAKGTLLIPAR